MRESNVVFAGTEFDRTTREPIDYANKILDKCKRELSILRDLKTAGVPKHALL